MLLYVFDFDHTGAVYVFNCSNYVSVIIPCRVGNLHESVLTQVMNWQQHPQGLNYLNFQ